MTHDPEAAERLAEVHDECVTGTADLHYRTAALIRAQAAEIANALREATNLATVLHRKHYAADAPNWEPEPDLMGLLLQIDNMTAGLTRAPQPDADEREAMAAVIAKARGHFTPSEMAWAGDGYHDEDRRVADALLAAGWTRKREEG